jgi:hypothetical protein
MNCASGTAMDIFDPTTEKARNAGMPQRFPNIFNKISMCVSATASHCEGSQPSC